MRSRRLTILGVSLLLTVVIGLTDVVRVRSIAANEQGPGQNTILPAVPPTGRRPGGQHPKLDGQVAAVAQSSREGGPQAAASEATRRGMRVSGGQVTVVLELTHQDRSRADSLVHQIGGTVVAQYENVAEVRVPAGALDGLASHADVTFIRAPYRSYQEPLPPGSRPTRRAAPSNSEIRPRAGAVLSEGVAASGANAWHTAAQLGAGAKIAIIDGGYGTLQASMDAGEIPPGTQLFNFGCGATNLNTGLHGIGVAEVVHDMAPQAQLYLICAGGTAADDTVVDLVITWGQAKDKAKDLGVHIVQHSLLTYDTDGNGTTGAAGGAITAIINDATANGILWVGITANHAEFHWSGTFADAHENSFHDFSSIDEINDIRPPFYILPGEDVRVVLTWNEWPASNHDFDVCLVLVPDPSQMLCTEGLQDGTQRPMEVLRLENVGQTALPMGIAIFDYSRFIGQPGLTNPRLDVVVRLSEGNLPNQGALQHFNRDGSVLLPGLAASALAVGAICWQNDRLESYSGQGPTQDGRRRPDIAGQSVVSTVAYGPWGSCPSDANGTGGFNGTSAAAPHVSGAAALVKGANPSFTPSQIRQFLQERAQDLGTPGPDNLYGFGKLFLGPPPALAASCSPRPRIDVSTQISGGRLAVTLTATGQGNTLQSIQFGPTDRPLANALIDLPNGQTGRTGSFLQVISPASTSYTFWVRRQTETTPKTPTTVPLVITDGCGPWTTFVGGGRDAGF